MIKKIFIIAILVVVALALGQARSRATYRIPAQVIQGEAGNCSIKARYAVANLWHRNGRMYGWDNQVDEDTYLVWRTYQDREEIYPESQFIFSSDDLKNERVISIIRNLKRAPLAIFLCSGNTALFLY